MEDVEGNIIVKRVGIMVVKYDKDLDGWVNGVIYEVLYGDIIKYLFYDYEMMGLRERDYIRNSKGESVLIKEIGWVEVNENFIYMIL